MWRRPSNCFITILSLLSQKYTAHADDNEECAAWSDLEECEGNKEYMLENCRTSCEEVNEKSFFSFFTLDLRFQCRNFLITMSNPNMLPKVNHSENSYRNRPPVSGILPNNSWALRIRDPSCVGSLGRGTVHKTHWRRLFHEYAIFPSYSRLSCSVWDFS